jgi:siroheme synthase-like protein
MTLLPKNSGLNTVQAEKTGGNQLFPVFIKLNDLHLMLIGAGNVGLEKLNAVLTNSPLAKVTIISQTILPQVNTLAAEFADVKIIQKAFAEQDLDNADIVIAATNDNELNNYIRLAAHDRKLLVNIADKPDLCDFYLGSIVQKGDLKVAISTNGKSPTVAKRLK